jgi:hypothetical protein
MNDPVKRITKMGIVPDGEMIEGVAGLMPVAFLPKSVPKFVGLWILTGVTLSLLLNVVLGSDGGIGRAMAVGFAVVFPSMVGMPTRHPDRMPGVRPRAGIAAVFPNQALSYIATDQRLLAIRTVKSGRRQYDRHIVASVPWTDVIGVSTRKRWLWTLLTFGFADGTLLTLSRPRSLWVRGGLARTVNIRALAPLPVAELSVPN